MPTLIERVANGEVVTVEGDPGLRINPIYVDDAVRVFEPALRFSGSGVFNVAGDEAVTMTELVELIGEVAGAPPTIEHTPACPGGRPGRRQHADARDARRRAAGLAARGPRPHRRQPAVRLHDADQGAALPRARRGQRAAAGTGRAGARARERRGRVRPDGLRVRHRRGAVRAVGPVAAARAEARRSASPRACATSTSSTSTSAGR